MIHVCVVDDDTLLLAGLKRVLRRATPEVRVTLCASGAEAIATLHTESVDVMISDLRMPMMDGHALMAAVQLDFPHVARVIMTGDLDPHQAFALQLVTHRIVAKPVDATTVLSLVQSLGKADAWSRANGEVRWAHAAAQRLIEQRASSISADVARGNPWLAMLLLQAANGGFAAGRKPLHAEAAVRSLGPMYLGMLLERLQSLASEAAAIPPADQVELTPGIDALLSWARENAVLLTPCVDARGDGATRSTADFVAIVESAVLLRAAAPSASSGAWADRDAVLRTARDAARIGIPFAVVQAVRESVNDPLCELGSVAGVVQSAFDLRAHGTIG